MSDPDLNHHDGLRRAGEVLAEPLALELLASKVPARLAYSAVDGSPRVQPVWIHWNGEQLIIGTGADSPKARAMTKDPRVALSIDTEAFPYQMLQIRGIAKIERVTGVAPEYELAAARYYGAEIGQRWIDHLLANRSESARITVTPHWAFVWDLSKAFPQIFA